MLINQKLYRLIAIVTLLSGLLLILGIFSVSYAASYTLFFCIILSLIVKKFFSLRNLIYWLIALTPLPLLYSIVFILLQKLIPNLLFLINYFFNIINIISIYGIFSISILVLVSGVILLWLAKKYFYLLNKNPHVFKPILIITIKVFIYLAIGMITALLFFTLLYSTIPVENSIALPLVKENQITIEPINNQLIKFNIKENIKTRESSVNKQLKQTNKQLNSIERGLILREVDVIPLNLNSHKWIYLELENGTTIKDKLCADICPQSMIKLVNFPAGSFYQAQDADNLKILPYLNTETITWSIPSLEREVKFAYIAYPYYYLRWFLKPFLLFIDKNKWVIVTVGTIVPMVYSPRLRPIIKVKNIGKVESNTTSEKKVESNTTSEKAVKTILILAANPKTSSPLRLDEEVREIDAGLQRAKKREQFDLKQRWAVRVRDVYRALLDFQPQIVHFSGHGTGNKGLALEDEIGCVQLVDEEALAKLFELFADRVECVILNACYSEVQAETIVKHIPYVIGMSKEIGDRAAIEFAVGFYDALGAGESVEFAYQLGCSAIRLAGIAEHLTPRLKKKQ
ncbi:hypothetical protein NIES2100_03130 [Calothrix sp. NIES-2100]|uniref:CHAT domain-containing protein n=1 Tax=Calothrix sp. NIES-2100 TaxID=1954172 RepID=UPI000B5ECC41|nr:hypothetical protein NIES2100_03130 [Calothrix sp. NIES-2100]